MSDNHLTDEQVKNWRLALCGLLGPYALLMPAGDIEKFRDKFQTEREKAMGKVTTTTKIWTEIINERDTLQLTKKFCIHILECIAAGKPGVNLSDGELRRYDKALAEDALKQLREAANE